MIQDAITLFLSIFIEAIPFILLGVLVSTAIKTWLTSEKIQSILPQNTLAQCAVMSLLGVFFPVCECGNVPVAKQLVEKKINPGATISFLLGAPILNPIVFITTIVAFPNSPEIWIGRMILGFCIATLVGYAFTFKKSNIILPATKKAPHCCHSQKNNAENFFDHAVFEFVNMSSIMIIGAAIAAATQSFLPREILLSIAETPWLAIGAFMLLAFIISICSTTDAFFALAYAHQFPASALIAFLVFGPMIDMKSLLLMNTTFSKKTLWYMSILVTLLVFSTTYFLDTFWL